MYYLEGFLGGWLFLATLKCFPNITHPFFCLIFYFKPKRLKLGWAMTKILFYISPKVIKAPPKVIFKCLSPQVSIVSVLPMLLLKHKVFTFIKEYTCGLLR
jgi:hypothetical protein